MVAVRGLVSAVIGTAVAYLAERFPLRTEALETGAGILLLCGFAVASLALPMI